MQINSCTLKLKWDQIKCSVYGSWWDIFGLLLSKHSDHDLGKKRHSVRLTFKLKLQHSTCVTVDYAEQVNHNITFFHYLEISRERNQNPSITLWVTLLPDKQTKPGKKNKQKHPYRETK